VEGQGYFFSRPEPAAQISDRLQKESTYVRQNPQALEGSADAVRPLDQRYGNAGQNEERRIQALYELDILDTPPEEAFDRITRIARVVLQAPMAMISLVDRDRQWFKSRQGVEDEETPRHFSFCTHTIQQDVPLIVPDALLDARFSDSPLVKFDGKVRSYVGVPLRLPGGHNIGALCVNDVVPRDVTPEQIEILQDLAGLVVDELQLRKIAFTDSATGVMTTRCFHALANRRIALARAEARHLSCIMIDVDSFKTINEVGGHAAGDRVLAYVAALCTEGLPEDDLVGRMGGDEFAILLLDADLERARLKAEALRAKLDRFADGTLPHATASFGLSHLQPEDSDIKDLLAKADKALYAAKRAGRNRVEVYATQAALPTLAA
jgi:diguanylate cyclase (GGDEF)-like protein